jgi:hypothetical protein
MLEADLMLRREGIATRAYDVLTILMVRRGQADLHRPLAPINNGEDHDHEDEPSGLRHSTRT